MFFPCMINRNPMTHHQQFEHPDHAGHTCKLCSSSHDPEHKASVGGICHNCVYKILILLVIVMVVVSYTAWFYVL